MPVRRWRPSTWLTIRAKWRTRCTPYRKKSIRPLEASYSEGECEDDDLASLLNEQSDDFLVWWANPEREFFNELLGERLLEAIDDLPEVFRSVVVLVNVEGFTYDETAEVLGVAPGTVRSRVKRGRTLLQKALWHQRPQKLEGVR